MLDFNQWGSSDEQQRQIDFDGINNHARANIPGLLNRYMPGGKIRGYEYQCGTIHGGEGNSCSTNVNTCIGSEFNGSSAGWNDPISLVAAVTGLQQSEAAKELAAWLNINPFGTGTPPPTLKIVKNDSEEKTSFARKLWAEGSQRKEHAYLSGKKVPMHCALRCKDEMLLIPMSDEHGIIYGVQRIWPDGTKKAIGTVKGYHFAFAGDKQTVFIAEGYATAATIALATKCQTYMCLSAGFMEDAAVRIRAMHPKSRIVLTADNDAGKKDGSNPGIESALKAAKAVNGEIAYPPTENGVAVDWNDFYISHGLEAINSLLNVNKIDEEGFKSVEDLLGREFPPINWAVEGILPEGLAVLSGPPKLGKSWLSLDICMAVITGGLALGKFASQKGSVLLCALEDNERRLQTRIQMRRGAGITMPLTGMLDFNLLSGASLPDFYYTTEMPKLNDGGMEYLVRFLDKHTDCKVVVIDTLQKVKPDSKGGKNAYEQDYQDIGALQKLALERRCCIIMITHNRKTETSDVVESISGSMGIPGAVDTIMVLKRGRGSSSATLYVTGRDISETTWDMNFDGTHGAWTVTGEQTDDSPIKSETQEDIYQVLKNYFIEHGKGLSLGYLFDELGGDGIAPQKPNLSATLKKLIARGVVEKDGFRYKPIIDWNDPDKPLPPLN